MKRITDKHIKTYRAKVHIETVLHRPFYTFILKVRVNLIKFLALAYFYRFQMIHALVCVSMCVSVCV